MKPETKPVFPGFRLIVEVFITSGHRKHFSGTFQKSVFVFWIFFFFFKGKSAVCINDTLGIAIPQSQNQQSSRIPSCATSQVLIFLLHLRP